MSDTPLTDALNSAFLDQHNAFCAGYRSTDVDEQEAYEAMYKHAVALERRLAAARKQALEGEREEMMSELTREEIAEIDAYMQSLPKGRVIRVPHSNSYLVGIERTPTSPRYETFSLPAYSLERLIAEFHNAPPSLNGLSNAAAFAALVNAWPLLRDMALRSLRQPEREGWMNVPREKLVSLVVKLRQRPLQDSLAHECSALIASALSAPQEKT